ncbi:unnamed protein product [Auanema sp. JU1783]|nr:unnamed protein product [Auanema sp. JU1783]
MISQLLLYFCLLPSIFSLNIGLFSSPFNSQQIKNAIQLSNLFVSQHHVTLIRPNPTCKSSLHVPSEKVHQIFLNVTGVACTRDFKPFTHRKLHKFSEFSDIVAENRIFKDASLQICKEMLKNDKLIKDISARKLDLAILSDVDYCLLGVIKKAGILKWALAEPGVPSSNILIENGITPASEGLVEKFQQIFIGAFNYLSEWWFLHSSLTELFQQQYSDDFPSIATLRHQITTIISGAQPILHNDLSFNNRIHFMNNSPNNKSPKKAENSVVIVALDDNNSLSESSRNALFELFRAKKTTKFVWLTKAQHEVPANVQLVVSKPNFANAKLLISNGDYSDMVEALHNGIPTLILGQSDLLEKNLQAFEKIEVSIVADNNLLIHYDTILSARYAVNVQSIKDMLSKQSEDIDLLIAKSLKSKNSNNSSVITTFSIDIAIILFVPLYILFMFIRKLLSLYYWSCFEMSYKEKIKND